jgi:hypothetical protein
MDTSTSKSIIPVFVFFLTLLLAWFIYSAIGLTKGLSTLGWPETQGKVISCEVKRVPSSKGPSKFQPVISYSYSVNSVEYTSNRYSSTMARGSSQWAKEVIGKHPKNSSIQVYYNPNNPTESVLDPGLQSDDFWMTIFSSFFFVVVLLAFRKQLKDRRAAMNSESSIL